MALVTLVTLVTSGLSKRLLPVRNRVHGVNSMRCRWLASDSSHSECEDQSACSTSSSSSSWTASSRAFRELANQRRNVRSFTAQPIPDHVLQDILQSTARAPSSFNTQPYACVLVQSQQDRNALSQAMLATNATKVREAAVVAVFAADLEPSRRVPHIQKLMQESGAPTAVINQFPMYVQLLSGEGNQLVGCARSFVTSMLSPVQALPQYVPTIAWSYKQTIFAASSLVFAANSHGLGTCIMEGFDEIRVRNAVHLPDHFSVPVVIAMGYPKDSPPAKPTPRLPPRQVFFHGKYGHPLKSD